VRLCDGAVLGQRLQHVVDDAGGQAGAGGGGFDQRHRALHDARVARVVRGVSQQAVGNQRLCVRAEGSCEGAAGAPHKGADGGSGQRGREGDERAARQLQQLQGGFGLCGGSSSSGCSSGVNVRVHHWCCCGAGQLVNAVSHRRVHERVFGRPCGYCLVLRIHVHAAMRMGVGYMEGRWGQGGRGRRLRVPGAQQSDWQEH
jgi:hypothetical protein